MKFGHFIREIGPESLYNGHKIIISIFCVVPSPIALKCRLFSSGICALLHCKCNDITFNIKNIIVKRLSENPMHDSG